MDQEQKLLSCACFPTLFSSSEKLFLLKKKDGKQLKEDFVLLSQRSSSNLKIASGTKFMKKSLRKQHSSLPTPSNQITPSLLAQNKGNRTGNDPIVDQFSTSYYFQEDRSFSIIDNLQINLSNNKTFHRFQTPDRLPQKKSISLDLLHNNLSSKHNLSSPQRKPALSFLPQYFNTPYKNHQQICLSPLQYHHSTQKVINYHLNTANSLIPQRIHNSVQYSNKEQNSETSQDFFKIKGFDKLLRLKKSQVTVNVSQVSSTKRKKINCRPAESDDEGCSQQTYSQVIGRGFDVQMKSLWENEVWQEEETAPSNTKLLLQKVYMNSPSKSQFWHEPCFTSYKHL